MAKEKSYLEAVLKMQILADDSPEMITLQEKRQEVEGVLRAAFPAADMTIRYGGSKAKGTMIRAIYDLDIICHFAHDETQAGDSLSEIYERVCEALRKHYVVDTTGRTALKLSTPDENVAYLHIDVVPGRFTDDSKTDAYLNQQHDEKQRLKTNVEIQIDYIRESGLTDTIKLAKYWQECSGLKVKTFILELLVVGILKAHKDKDIDEQLRIFWEYLRDEIDDIAIEDPANPFGNDLSEILDGTRPRLKLAAELTLQTIADSGLEAVFGKTDTQINEVARASLIARLPQIHPERPKPKPWA